MNDCEHKKNLVYQKTGDYIQCVDCKEIIWVGIKDNEEKCDCSSRIEKECYVIHSDNCFLSKEFDEKLQELNGGFLKNNQPKI